MSEDGALRVLHCFRAPLGGLFRHVCDLARGQNELGFGVGIVCGAAGEGEHAAQELERLRECCALGVTRIDMPRLPHWRDLAAIRVLGRLLREARPHVVHGHGAKGGAYARLAARQAGACALYTPHGGTLHYSPGTGTGLLYLRMERWLQPRTDGLIFESAFGADAYARKVGKVRCPQAIIHNGLHQREFVAARPGSSPEFDFVFVGELRTLKGVDVLLDAFARIRERRTARLLIAGSGPREESLRERLRALRLESAVTLCAPVHPATRAFARARCVVVPSLAESLPYVVMEAAAAGVPVVATRVGGIGEIFGPHASRLVTPGDAGALASAMQAVLDAPQAAEGFARLLHERTHECFHVRRMLSETVDFYRQVLGSTPRP